MKARFAELLHILGKKNKDLAMELGVSPNSITEVLKGRTQYIPSRWLIHLYACYAVNIHWLFSGQGRPLLNQGISGVELAADLKSYTYFFPEDMRHRLRHLSVSQKRSLTHFLHFLHYQSQLVTDGEVQEMEHIFDSPSDMVGTNASFDSTNHSTNHRGSNEIYHQSESRQARHSLYNDNQIPGYDDNILDQAQQEDGSTPKVALKSGARKTPLTDLAENPDIRQVPILGSIAAGVPIFAAENFEGLISLSVPGLAGMRENDKLFALRVKGDSMIDAAILDGDLAIIQHGNDIHSLPNRSIVAMLLDDEATLKILLKSDGKYILQPANDRYEPLELGRYDQASLLGKMLTVIRQY